jgi:membrane protein DedA with SNARE-associated domain
VDTDPAASPSPTSLTGEAASTQSPLLDDIVRPSLPPPKLGRGVLIALGLLFGSSSLGAALAPYLAVHHPLVLLALNPWPRHMILVAPHTPMVPFVLIATARSLLTCIVMYEIGLRYGPGGVRLFEKRSPSIGRFLRYFESVFGRAAPLFLLISPGPMTSTLSGIAGLSRVLTWAISGLGLAIWACINYQVGDWLQPYTAPILTFIQRHLVETTLACIVIVAGYQWIARKRRLRQASSS